MKRITSEASGPAGLGPRELARVEGHSQQTSAYMGLTATGRVDGMEFILTAADHATLSILWGRLMGPLLPLRNPVYRTALVPASRFELRPGGIGGSVSEPDRG